MSRVKRGKVRTKKRQAILSQAKGYKWGRKKLIRQAKTAIKKAGVHSFRDRRIKKRTTRRLWQIRLNAAVRKFELSYSRFIDLLNKKNIALDRKILSDIAIQNPEIFAKIIDQIKK